MKNLFLFASLFLTLSITGQSQETDQVKNTIDAFFKAFHAQDSIGLKNVVLRDVTIHTIGRDKDGKPMVKVEEFANLVKSIINIPDSVRFQEKLLDYDIRIDGPMANAWTPYEFWVNDTFRHCGVNSFQLLKQEDTWKIIYLIDTRRREGCHSTSK